MRITLILTSLLLLCGIACTPTIKSALADAQLGEAVIQHENGSFSKKMPLEEALTSLRNNEKLYLSSGRIKLFDPINIKGLENIQIIGDNTALVAKEDMPVLTFNYTRNVTLRGLLVVHEIGEWCSQNCVEFYESSNLNIQDCKFDGSGYFGLALSNVQGANIQNNQFYNCHTGLATWGSSNLLVKGNSFSNNRDTDIYEQEGTQFSNDVKADNTFAKK